MSTAIQQSPAASLTTLDQGTMLSLVSGGDCARLSPAQKTAYYTARCEAAGLDPRAQPFAFVKLNGKEVLYALKTASDQLAAKHGVRLTITDQRTEEGIRVVTVRAETKDGRVTEEIGALNVKGLLGEPLANALMKCVTKAKRRAILSLCGLGMLDETEVESIPHAAPVSAEPPRSLPRPDPVVEREPDLAEADNTRRAARAIVEAAEVLDGEIVPPAPKVAPKAEPQPVTVDGGRVHRGLLWKRLTAHKTAKMANDWIAGVVGRHAAYSSLTEEEIAKLVTELDRLDAVP